MARAARRRTAWPHVLHGGAKPRLPRRRARSGRPTARPAASPIATFAADYLDPRGLARSARRCARAATTEFENVPAAALEFLARIARDARRRQASRSRRTASARRRSSPEHGFAVAPFAVLRTEADARARRRSAAARHRQERALRLRRQGTGPRCIARRGRRARSTAMGGVPCVLERFVSTSRRSLGDRRARRRRRNVDVAGRREPAPRRHPRRLDRAGARRRRARRRRRATSRPAIAATLDYRGVLCVEMFVDDGRRLARQRDRAAPAQQRPLHDRRLRDVAVRAAGARARRPAARRHAAAHAGGDGEPARRHLVRRARRRAARARLDARARHPGAKLHLYGKREPRRGRKMGHVTCLGATLDDALATARAIKRDLGIPGADDL